MIETGVRTRILGTAAAPARERRVRLLSALAVGAGVSLLVLLLSGSGLLTLWELRTQDLRTRWTLRTSSGKVRDDVVLLAITDQSIETVYEKNKLPYPWDWDFYALFLAACEEGKASAVAFDLVLREAREGSEELAKALRSAPPTYFAAVFWDKGKGKPAEKLPSDVLDRWAIQVQNDGSVTLPEPFERLDAPAPVLWPGMAGACVISTPRDRDGLIRNYRLLISHRGRVYPSFPVAALMAREKTRDVRIEKRTLRVGRVSVPLQADGSILLRWYEPSVSFPWVESTRVLARMSGEDGRGFEPSELSGKTVIVGASAAALTDLRWTPVTDAMPGPELHAVALANALNGDVLRAAPLWAQVLLVLATAFGVAFGTRYASAGVGASAAALVFGGFTALAIAAFRAGWVLEMVPGTLAVGLSYAAASAVNYLFEGRQRQRIKRDFQRYMSPKVVEKILKNPDALSLKGERKILTIFFMDFAGFTSMSEKLDPAEMVILISDYHNEAAEEIFATEGTVDKYIGDAIMAFWNDPIEQEDHALRACLSAIAAQKRLVKMAAMMRERGLPEMSARIGINTGFATVGNMGAKGQVNYTVIGDEVNLASRLEGVNKEFGTSIIVGESTYIPVKERLEARELALIKVKGRKAPVRIFELLGLKGEIPPERLAAARDFEGALKAFQARRFAESAPVFRRLAAAGDEASEVYAELCDLYAQEPPPADWDGSYQMTGK